MSWFINLWKEKKLFRNIFNFFPFIAGFPIFVPVPWCCIKATKLYYYEIFPWDIFSKFSSKNFSRMQTDLVDGSSMCIKFLNCKYFSHFFRKCSVINTEYQKTFKERQDFDERRLYCHLGYMVTMKSNNSFSFSTNTFLQIL